MLERLNGPFVAEVVNLAYPVGDLVLLMFVAVAYSLSGWRPGRAWLLLGAGVTVTRRRRHVFVYQVASGTYVAGTVLDAMWPASMALLAAGGLDARPPRSAASRSTRRTRSC